MLDQTYYRKTDEIIEHYGRKAASLIPIMQDIQAEYRYLPGELLTYVAEQILSLIHIQMCIRDSAYAEELNKKADAMLEKYTKIADETFDSVLGRLKQEEPDKWQSSYQVKK